MQWPLPAVGVSKFSLHPSIVPSYSDSLGLCDDLDIDFKASKGSGPFPWELLTVSTVSCTGFTDVTDNCLVENNPLLGGNTTIDQTNLFVHVPRYNFPTGTGTIVFRASLRNILGETVTKVIQIHLVANAKPTFILAGKFFYIKFHPFHSFFMQCFHAMLLNSLFHFFSQVHQHVKCYVHKTRLLL